MLPVDSVGPFLYLAARACLQRSDCRCHCLLLSAPRWLLSAPLCSCLLMSAPLCPSLPLVASLCPSLFPSSFSAIRCPSLPLSAIRSPGGVLGEVLGGPGGLWGGPGGSLWLCQGSSGRKVWFHKMFHGVAHWPTHVSRTCAKARWSDRPVRAPHMRMARGEAILRPAV